MSSGKTADVVMALDDRGVGRAALDDVGVQGALHEERGVGEAAGVLLEDPHEQLADDLALLLGLGDAPQPLEEPLAGVDVDELDAHVPPEGLDDLLGLALPHQPGVDVHAGELVADGPVDERRGHGGVDPAGQPADGPAVADLAAHRLDLGVDDGRHRPGRPAPAHVEQEALGASPGRPACAPPRVELDAVDPPATCLEHGHGDVGRASRHREALRGPHDGVEVAHPDRLRPRRAGRWPRPSISSSVRPYSPRPVRATSPPSCCARSWAP